MRIDPPPKTHTHTTCGRRSLSMLGRLQDIKGVLSGVFPAVGYLKKIVLWVTSNSGGARGIEIVLNKIQISGRAMRSYRTSLNIWVDVQNRTIATRKPPLDIPLQYIYSTWKRNWHGKIVEKKEERNNWFRKKKEGRSLQYHHEKHLENVFINMSVSSSIRFHKYRLQKQLRAYDKNKKKTKQLGEIKISAHPHNTYQSFKDGICQRTNQVAIAYSLSIFQTLGKKTKQTSNNAFPPTIFRRSQETWTHGTGTKP